MGAVTPIAALERAVHCFDRANDTSHRAVAFARALDVVRGIDADELARRAADGSLTALDGIGSTTATVITEALTGRTPTYLDDLERRTQVPITPEGAAIRAALRGDLHLHSRWSDGRATTEAMARTAIALGHEYMVISDHSQRMTMVHGLSAERLTEQAAEVADLNRRLAPFRILTGIEVDILEDGSLDHPDEVLAGLDVVVASVHHKLNMSAGPMTERLVRAVSNPHVDVLGHCTGRMPPKRPPSQFDAERVFAACAAHRTAVEINCRPERLDPPRALLREAIARNCHFTISTDAHATGHLELQPLGCDRAAQVGVPVDRILNSWPLTRLLAWVGVGVGADQVCR